MIEAYFGGAFVTLIWFAFRVPPRSLVEAVVTAAAIALWPLFYLYAAYCLARSVLAGDVA